MVGAKLRYRVRLDLRKTSPNPDAANARPESVFSERGEPVGSSSEEKQIMGGSGKLGAVGILGKSSKNTFRRCAIQVTRLWQKVCQAVDKHRIAAASLAGLMVLVAILQVVSVYQVDRQYALPGQSQKLLGGVNKNITSKITYDREDQAYYINKDGIGVDQQALQGKDPAAVAQALQRQRVGEGDNKQAANSMMYAAKLPADPAKGVTFYDTDLDASFTLKPQFQLMSGRAEQGRVVYPTGSGVQLVYTAKGNGLKEDVVLQKPVGDSLELAYTLELPDTLVARLLEDGSGNLGVYSVDPLLLGNMTYGSNDDQAKVESARKSAKKDHLAFVLPAPVITSANGQTGSAKAKFTLGEGGKQLTVSASGLKSAAYPLSIDPSIVVSSTSDFMTGLGDNDNIDFATDGQIKRGGLSGGSVGSWAATTSFTTARRGHTAVAYNGYVYIIGGFYNNGSDHYLSDVQYAPLNSDGTVGSWSATTSLTTTRYYHTSVAYNGYLYIMGGAYGGSTNDVQYAAINPNGTIGSWTATTSFGTARYGHASVAYNGYLYVMGGYNGSYLSSTQYAAIKSDGSLGNWAATTSLVAGVAYLSSVAYNGYIYTLGGYDVGYYTSVRYAPLNSDGTIGTWISTTTFSGARYGHTSVISNGYIYVCGGGGGTYLNTAQYAPINANGSVGPWSNTTSFTTARRYQTSVVYNGYAYVMGGTGGTTTDYSDVQYTAINPAGVTADSYAATTALSSWRRGHASVAYNGRMYVIGGFNGSSLGTVEYATINTDGTLGSWTATTSVIPPRFGHTAVAYNGYMYVLGGYNIGYLDDVQYAPINSNGTLGSWTATTSFTTARSYHTSVAYNGYLYVMGGSDITIRDDVQYAPINSNGTIGTWTATTSFTTARRGHASVVYGKYVYIIGGESSGGNLNDVQYAPINSDGTIGTWTATTSFTTARSYHASVVSNGYLYILGGYTGSYLSNVQYAPINSDGTVGSWATTTPMSPGASSGHTAIAYNGYMYTMGGYNGSYQNAVSYTRINNGGLGTTGTWASTTSFTTDRDEHASVAYNGYVYITGGSSYGNPKNDVQYAPINSNGTIGTWTATTSFTTARYGHTSVVYNGYLYVIGGTYSLSTQFLNDVQYAPINSNGTVGTWTATTSFTTARRGHTSVVYNGYLYVIGGMQGGGAYNDVQYAPINSDGTVGTWNTATSLSVARVHHTSVVYNGYLYVIGGYIRDDVQYAPINSNGTIGTWTATTSFTTARYGHTSVAYNGYLYLLGGLNSSGGRSDVQYAPINSNGTIGTWTATTSLASVNYNHSSVIYNGYVYIVGGGNGGTNAVRYAQLNTIPRKARYSKLVNFGSSGLLSRLEYTGTVPGGASAFSYRIANGSGVFGSATSATGLPDTTDPCVATTLTPYSLVQLSVTLDDSQSATFPDSASTNNSYLSDITLHYGGAVAAPNVRLRGGKYFSSDTQSSQPLDTCH
jgi:N-acetylneuraminic acid mutarotase